MIITIHQPDFLPWLGFFDRLQKSDLYIILDDVQFIRQGWCHRDKIKGPQGINWLTVPVIKKGRFTQRICDTRIDWSQNWPERHMGQLQAAYGRCPQHTAILAKLHDIYAQQPDNLIDLNLALLEFATTRMGITTPWKFASEACADSTRTERLLDLLLYFGADTYLTGSGSRDYLDEEMLARRGIRVQWQTFVPQPYPQMHGDFVPGLSVLDFLMNQRPQ